MRSSFNLCTTRNSLMYIAVRNHWNKDFAPAPFPKTKEERLAAIEKYQVMPSQYKPFPDDGRGWGDYPNLPIQSADSRDPFYPWDCPETKRNYRELIQAEEDMYGEHRYDVSARLRIPIHIQFMQTIGVLLLLFTIYSLGEKVKCFHSVAEKQYPKPHEKHYTFELE
ncbi:hypothetical protein RI129_000774 [Pyrocoelia pectoralis]|uniref:NADH dehydrogenase [ubiquinone] 1 beta subcomplex subunit 8, mitochondrial n=1 Tax=Pyrocoelia pectoralis TaxID=417401 RepID=A0AAN7ZJJ4_9COLE